MTTDTDQITQRLEDVARVFHGHRKAMEAQGEVLRQVLREAADAGIYQTRITEISGLDRGTVRAWLGMPRKSRR